MWRSFDVGAVVDAMSSDAQVVAGVGGLNRQVSRAKTAATPELLRTVGAGEFVVTSAEALLATDEAWEHLLGRFDAARVAAVAVRIDGDNPLPEALLRAADAQAVPLITFPSEAVLADVTTAVLDALLDAQGRRLERILDIHQRFTPIVLAGGGAPEIATTLYLLLGCPVAVLDPEGRATVVVPSDAEVGVDFAESRWVRQPILAGEFRYGEIVALTTETELDDEGRLALQRASSSIAVRMAHATAAAAERARFAATSLEELISGHAGDIADVAERAISFGWDLARPRAVLLASIDPPVDQDVVSTALATISAAAQTTLGREAIVWTRSTTIAALIAPETAEPAERRAIAERLRRELDERVVDVNVSIGVGRRVDDPMSIPRSYLEASRAVDVGRWARGRHVTAVFDQLGLERLLASTPTEDLAEFVEQAIGPLVDYDRSHQSELVATLGMWLETRNMAEGARRLHVHYNTFKNRLDRIESILGALIGDAARSLECEVAVYVFRHYDGPWHPDGASRNASRRWYHPPGVGEPRLPARRPRSVQRDAHVREHLSEAV
ncbi:MAG: PucR family transcriptional regulator ligand-binding domain-containing protein [Candidatus Microthrix sp.]|nr:PucR family transcriptional regulator ligand-binding domain-containing protein [Candidatus Microthrix sp.]